MHYKRWATHGDPTVVKEPGHWKRRRVRVDGYISVWVPSHPIAYTDGYVLEHRKVWFDVHGPIPSGFHVHHINGDKADNRIENLELLDESTHHHQHVVAAGVITNQFGTWPLRANLLKGRSP